MVGRYSLVCTILPELSLVGYAIIYPVMRKIKAVILAAGRGTRMGKLSEDVPKPMLDAGGANLIEWKILSLPEEISEVVLVVGHLGKQIKKYFGREFAGKKIFYAEQKELNGTAGALFCAKELLVPDFFLVMMGDDLYGREDIKKMIGDGWAMLAKKMDNEGKGAKIVVGGSGVIKEVVENTDLKPGDWSNAGMYFLGSEIFNYPLVPKSPGSLEFGLPQTVAVAVRDVPVKIVPAEQWIQVSSPEDMKKAEEAVAMWNK